MNENESCKLSIEDLKKLTNDKNISIELANEIINSLYTLSLIAYQIEQQH